MSALVPPAALMISRTTNAQTPQTADIKPEKKEQGICKGHHPTRKDFYQSVRMIPPANVLEIIDNRLNYAYAEQGIELGSFELESGYSVVPPSFSRTNHSGCYGITYCEKHLVILLIDVLDNKLCQTTRN